MYVYTHTHIHAHMSIGVCVCVWVCVCVCTWSQGRGMEEVMDRYFHLMDSRCVYVCVCAPVHNPRIRHTHTHTHTHTDSKFLPLMQGRDWIVNAYFAALPDTYVVHPSLFTIEATSTTIGKEGEETLYRLNRQVKSNQVPTQTVCLCMCVCVCVCVCLDVAVCHWSIYSLSFHSSHPHMHIHIHIHTHRDTWPRQRQCSLLAPLLEI